MVSHVEGGLWGKRGSGVPLVPVNEATLRGLARTS